MSYKILSNYVDVIFRCHTTQLFSRETKIHNMKGMISKPKILQDKTFVWQGTSLCRRILRFTNMVDAGTCTWKNFDFGQLGV